MKGFMLGKGAQFAAFQILTDAVCQGGAGWHPKLDGNPLSEQPQQDSFPGPVLQEHPTPTPLCDSVQS